VKVDEYIGQYDCIPACVLMVELFVKLFIA